METYLKRAYRQRLAKSKLKTAGDENEYPFWDYRSRRGSISTSGSGTSTSGSCGSSSFDGCSLSSISSIRSADSVSLHSNASSSDSESIMVTGDPYRLQLQFLVDAHEVMPLTELYQPVLDWVDQDLHIFRVEERKDEPDFNQSMNQPKRFSRMPGLAVMLFLSEEGPLGYERLQGAQRRFEKSPWKFHHTETVSQGKINPYPFNSSDYYYTSEELPLWAVRLVHCRKEFIRIVLFTSEECWSDMIEFYKLVIGLETDVNKDDFCLFTIHSRDSYDVQFALKKLKGETKPRVLDSVKLKFKVKDVGSLVPLFPNVCKPISDRMWQTQDHDGNTIVIEVTAGTGNATRPKSSTPSLGVGMQSASSYISRSSSGSSSRSSTQSEKSVQSLTSVTSSLSSSTNSSMTTVSSDTSESIITRRVTTRPPRDRSLLNELPPKLPPRVPRKPRFVAPEMPEEPKQCLASLQGFYV